MDRFEEILKEISELRQKKGKDYGSDEDNFANVRASSEWGLPAWIGAMIRISDKVRRLQKFAQTGQLANESAIDSLRDIAVYAIIAQILLEGDLQASFLNQEKQSMTFPKLP